MSVIHVISTILLGPLLLWQGKKVRRNTPKLPEAQGPRHGSLVKSACSQREQLKILIIGDSSAAGVGADTQENALSGQLVKLLSTSYDIEWALHAKTGAKTDDGLEWITSLPAERIDYVISVFGVNDVTSGKTLSNWRRSQTQFRKLISQRYPEAMLICCGLPPVHGFPALPQPLRWYLGRRATQFDNDLKRHTATASKVHYLDLRFTQDVSKMATDGFHPGPEVYNLWASKLNSLVMQSNSD